LCLSKHQLLKNLPNPFGTNSKASGKGLLEILIENGSKTEFLRAIVWHFPRKGPSLNPLQKHQITKNPSNPLKKP
jgi:hypothetical protein